MRQLANFIQRKDFHYRCLPIVLVGLAIMVTGCPHNEYIVQLKPQGSRIERTLVFYRADGVNPNTGSPNYQPFEAQELAAITALYPAGGLTNDGDRHEIRGGFANNLPADVGGAGAYTNLVTTMGEAGFYAERFRGNDDLAGLTERRLQAADQLTDLIVGWSQMELGRERGYGKLRQFLKVDFRRDLKNFSTYWWEGKLASDYKTNADEEFAVRFGQYLYERGYFSIGELPGLLGAVTGDDQSALYRLMQRLVARKMGIPDTTPVPAALAFLANEATLKTSFDKYLAGTGLYRARLKQWQHDQKRHPDLKRPEAADVAKDAFNHLIEFALSGRPNHLVVRLSLPSAPAHSNGRWDEALKEVVWDTSIEERTNAMQLPIACYASWTQADEQFQTEHFGQVALTGDDLAQYCLWRTDLDAQRGGEWDAFLKGLRPDDGLKKRLDAFRFTGESDQIETNGQPKVASPSAYPRELLKNALR